MVTLNPAEYFGFRDLGAVAPGRWADGVVLESLNPPRPVMTLVAGEWVWRKGGRVRGFGEALSPEACPSFRLAGLSRDALRVPAREGRIRAMERIPGQILTRQRWMRPSVRDREVVSDPSRDLLKIAVVERHRATGRLGLGFVRGFGLRRGAIASSVAHDSHNVVAVGATDEELLGAIEAVAAMQGGIAVVEGPRVTARLPLPMAGLMSPWPLTRVAATHRRLREAARHLGCKVEDPFMALSFLALPVIPDLKLTDQGLVDVRAFEWVGLFEGT
jgi:adenine deaminase